MAWTADPNIMDVWNTFCRHATHSDTNSLNKLALIQNLMHVPFHGVYSLCIYYTLLLIDLKILDFGGQIRPLSHIVLYGQHLACKISGKCSAYFICTNIFKMWIVDFRHIFFLILFLVNIITYIFSYIQLWMICN